MTDPTAGVADESVEMGLAAMESIVNGPRAIVRQRIGPTKSWLRGLAQAVFEVFEKSRETPLRRGLGTQRPDEQTDDKRRTEGNEKCAAGVATHTLIRLRIVLGCDGGGVFDSGFIHDYGEREVEFRSGRIRTP
ncbi:MAG: hypothetical protein WCF18_22375 [Chthoniobacteraceae bacterium]